MFRLASFLCAALLVGAGGCSSQAATLDLIAAARQGIAIQRQAQDQMHRQIVEQLKAQQAALDSAFDADVRLVAAGQVTGSAGEAVTITPEWIISARKGYVAARDTIGEQIVTADGDNNVWLDNLTSCDRTLELAQQLILRQAAVAEDIKQYLMQIHRRLIDEK